MAAVYCKNSPVEFASLTPSRTMLGHDFPAGCKLRFQRFACMLAKEISAASMISPSGPSKSHSDSSSDPNQSLKPLFLSEISSMVEIVGVFMTKIDALHFAVLDESNIADDSLGASTNHPFPTSTSPGASPSKPSKKRILKQRLASFRELSICVFPMYKWIVMDQESLDISNSQKILKQVREANLNEEAHDSIMQEIESDEHATKLSKNFAKSMDDELNAELKNSLRESGLLQRNQSKSNKAPKKDKLVTSNISVKVCVTFFLLCACVD